MIPQLKVYVNSHRPSVSIPQYMDHMVTHSIPDITTKGTEKYLSWKQHMNKKYIQISWVLTNLMVTFKKRYAKYRIYVCPNETYIL